MKVFKIEILIIDHDEIGEDAVISTIENARYPNRCINPEVKRVVSADIEWSEDHPLNLHSQAEEEYLRLFPNEQEKT